MLKLLIFLLLFIAASVITALSPDHLFTAIGAYGALVGVPSAWELYIEGMVRLERYHHREETPLSATYQQEWPN